VGKLVIMPTTKYGLYFTDLSHRVFPLTLVPENDEWSVNLPREQPIALHVRLILPDYGYCWLTADRLGEGYAGGNIDLLAEVWHSQVARVGRLAARCCKPIDLSETNNLWQTGNRLKAIERVVIFGEDLELTHARQSLDSQPSAPSISATLFQCGPSWLKLDPIQKPNILRPRQQWELIAAVANGTILPNFWGWVEYQRGNYLWEPLDHIAAFAAERHMKLKSFAICWGGSLPPWFKELDFTQQLLAIEKWAQALIARYGKQVEIWEFVNELHDWNFANPLHWNHEQILKITRLVSDLVGSLAPGKPRVINNCLVWGEYVQEGKGGGPWSPLTYLEEVIASGIAFEGIGLQWIFRYLGQENRDLLECALHLERFAVLNKALYLTEMGVPSSPRPRDAAPDAPLDLAVGWRGTWSAERQADWLEAWYTIAASYNVTFMNWWDFADLDAFIVNGGMVDADGKPKPSYYQWLDMCSRRHWGRFADTGNKK
jgi:GH35 family endo-1,4-beta-xylanase